MAQELMSFGKLAQSRGNISKSDNLMMLTSQVYNTMMNMALEVSEANVSGSR